MDGTLREKLERIAPGRLADELVGLGNRDGEVRRRLEMLAAEDDHGALSAVLRRRIESLGRDPDSVSYGGSFSYAQDLQYLVDTIREPLLPRDPDAAFELADLFLQSDARVFECVDDSAGAVGDVFRTACRLWLEAAAQSTVKRDWMSYFKKTIAKNDYGARDELLPNAAILFSEPELRSVAAERLAAACVPPRDDRMSDWAAFSARVGASQLALTLRDPRLHEVVGGPGTMPRFELSLLLLASVPICILNGSQS